MDGTTTSINSILKNLIENFNTLLDCPARYSGEFNEHKIHCFVEYIEYYKRKKCIRDEQALQELQYLLVDNAYNWWMRRKSNIDTWSEALTILENQYSKQRPANKVYEEILKYSYENYQSKQDFIDDKIELFTELSQPELTEKVKLDIIYALLPNDIQNKIRLEDITSVKDFKKHLRLVQSDVDIVPSDQANAVLNSETSGLSTVLAESDNIRTPNKHTANEEVNKQIHSENHYNGDSEKSTFIKVKRTEDLMPRDVKEEEFISNDTNAADTNNTFHTNQEHFQIDSDIMNQINNIIDETEMCIEAVNNSEGASSSLSQPSNSTITLELLGFQLDAPKQIEIADTLSKSSPNSTRKTRKRCSYCRSCKHTSQACFKWAKQIKLHPERFSKAKVCDGSSSLEKAKTAEPSEIPPSSIASKNSSLLNVQTNEISVASPNITNLAPVTTLDPTPAYAGSAAILNNIPEKSINAILTTKLIPAINGKAPNKNLAAKLRNANSPSPKCHQCGTIGFYKSICPNCSPIYNTNSHR